MMQAEREMTVESDGPFDGMRALLVRELPPIETCPVMSADPRELEAFQLIGFVLEIVSELLMLKTIDLYAARWEAVSLPDDPETSTALFEFQLEELRAKALLVQSMDENPKLFVVVVK